MIIARHRLPLSSFLVLLLFAVFVQLSQAKAAEVRFSWAVLLDTEQGFSALDFSSPVKVSEGSALQIYLQPDEGTFVYLFLLDSSNFFSPIFPASRNYYDNNPTGEEIRIPAGQDRFTTLPPAGQEKFYLIGSPSRLLELEQLAEKCFVNPGDVHSQASLYEKVRSLRRQYSKLTQYTEKGMPVSGSMRNLNKTRGPGAEEDFVATTVKANGFYSRILRLNHD